MSNVLIPRLSTNACSQVHVKSLLKISALNIPYILCMIALQRVPWSHVPGGIKLGATGKSILYHSELYYYRCNMKGARKVPVSQCKYKPALKTNILLRNHFVIKQKQ